LHGVRSDDLHQQVVLCEALKLRETLSTIPFQQQKSVGTPNRRTATIDTNTLLSHCRVNVLASPPSGFPVGVTGGVLVEAISNIVFDIELWCAAWARVGARGDPGVSTRERVAKGASGGRVR
jgi:hypothetical protein